MTYFYGIMSYQFIDMKWYA